MNGSKFVTGLQCSSKKICSLKFRDTVPSI